jgi:lysozyme
MSDPAPYLPPVMSDVVIDLYHGDAVQNFAAAKASGVEGVILKVDQGVSFNDTAFVSRAAQVLQAGLLLGGYHYFDSSADAASQTSHFLSDLMKTPPGFRPAIDFEPDPGSRALQNAVANMVTAFYSMRGTWPLLYTLRWSIVVPTNPILLNCPLWLAEYGSRPICPPGWSKWALWQHTDGHVGSGVVPVPGIGPCDRSRFAGTVDELKAWWGSLTP